MLEKKIRKGFVCRFCFSFFLNSFFFIVLVEYEDLIADLRKKADDERTKKEAVCFQI